MSDITKCTDIKCPSKDKCYRRAATSAEYQWYADFNREPDAEKCESFWPVGQETDKPKTHKRKTHL